MNVRYPQLNHLHGRARTAARWRIRLAALHAKGLTAHRTQRKDRRQFHPELAPLTGQARKNARARIYAARLVKQGLTTHGTPRKPIHYRSYPELAGLTGQARTNARANIRNADRRRRGLTARGTPRKLHYWSDPTPTERAWRQFRDSFGVQPLGCSAS